MKQITQFANVVGAPNDVITLDPQGSSQDWMMAEAVVANEPTSVLVEQGIVKVYKAPKDVDEVRVPIGRNKQLTWSTLDWRAASTVVGSDVSAQALAILEYRKMRPVGKTANIFLPYGIDLINKIDYDYYVKMLATDAARQKEADALSVIMGTSANVETFTQKYAAGGFISGGSVITGSTLTPNDLLKAKELLTTGSNVNHADFVLVHPKQFRQLNSHADFAPGATARGAMMRKARFSERTGDLVAFEGMDIVVSELVPAGSVAANTAFVNAGHWALVGTRGLCGARAEHLGMTIKSMDHPLFHGTFKIVDMDYAHDILVDEAQVLLRCADA